MSDSLPAAADVVVIGGGIVGTCAAYWLARQGARVVQLDQESLAAGATGRNGGFMTLGTAEPYSRAVARLGRPRADAIWRLTLDSRALLRDLLAQAAQRGQTPAALWLFAPLE